MIRVVAAGAIDLTEVSVPIIARTSRILADPAVAHSSINLAHTYDARFEDPVDTLDQEIARDLERRASTTDIVYLVPTLPGDITVAALNREIVSGISAAVPDRNGFAAGRCVVIDGLEIAQAELQAPFERGYLAMDPTVATIVTNWYGDAVQELAGRRLRGLYGVDETPGRKLGLELLIPPVERLQPAASIAELEHIVARLRRPDGCPWDREQTRESLFPQFVDELKELGEAIESGDVENQREELGDVLFHVVAQCQLAAEAGDFSLDDVLREVTAKLVRRHPHVFGDVVAESYDDVLATWNRVKAEEKAAGAAERN